MSISFSDFLAALTGSVTGLIDVNKTFADLPQGIWKKYELWCYFLVFIAFNASCAWLVYHNLEKAPIVSFVPQWLKSSPEELKAIVAGLVFYTLARLKLTTITLKNGEELPVVTEAIYNAIKGFSFNNINKVLSNMRYQAARNRSRRCTLDELANEAKGLTNADFLKTEADRITSKDWIKNTLDDPNSTEQEKKMALAEYIEYGIRQKKS